MADFKPVQPGEPVTLGADVWNAIVDAALAEQRRRHSVTWEVSPHPEQQTIVRVRNDTGGDLPRHAIVDLTAGPIFAPGASPDAFLDTVTFRGGVPTVQTRHAFGVLSEPIGAGGIGRATVAGIAPCRVNMIDAAHVSAEAVAGDSTRLQSVQYPGNPQNVLWAEAGTGTRWALVRQDAGDCGCAAGPIPPCCPDLPAVLYLSDGLGTIELVRDGPTPISFLDPGAWWGCAPRSVTGGRTFDPDTFACGTEPMDFETHLVFALECLEGFGYRLWVFFHQCTDVDVAHLRPSPPCEQTWSPDYQTVWVNYPAELPAESCDPFSWQYQSLAFEETAGFQGLGALDEIYGEPPLWTVTE